VFLLFLIRVVSHIWFERSVEPKRETSAACVTLQGCATVALAGCSDDPAPDEVMGEAD
jgi:hypothetical protein